MYHYGLSFVLGSATFNVSSNLYFETLGHDGATKALEIGWCLLASCFPALDNVFDGWNGEMGFMNELDAFTENCFKEIGHGRWKRKGVIGTTAFLIATCFAPGFD